MFGAVCIGPNSQQGYSGVKGNKRAKVIIIFRDYVDFLFLLFSIRYSEYDVRSMLSIFYVQREAHCDNLIEIHNSLDIFKISNFK